MNFEIYRLIIDTLTPLTVVVLGLFINKRLKKLDQLQWTNQKLTEKRLALYDDITPLLNKLLCFYTWRGDWKEISPNDVIETKRFLDKTINIYRYLLGEEFFKEYRSFIQILFSQFTGPGRNAKIKSSIKSGYGDRTINCNYKWNLDWNDEFTSEEEVVPIPKVMEKYNILMNTFKNILGIINNSEDHF